MKNEREVRSERKREFKRTQRRRGEWHFSCDVTHKEREAQRERRRKEREGDRGIEEERERPGDVEVET